MNGEMKAALLIVAVWLWLIYIVPSKIIKGVLSLGLLLVVSQMLMR